MGSSNVVPHPDLPRGAGGGCLPVLLWLCGKQGEDGQHGQAGRAGGSKQTQEVGTLAINVVGQDPGLKSPVQHRRNPV